jgi:hypothetical protein
MDIDDVKEPTPDGAQSPLFEPEAPASGLPSPSMPIAVMVAPIIDLSMPPDEREEDRTSPYMLKLKGIEAFAKAEMCKCYAIYLGTEAETVPSTSVPSTKRKGKHTEGFHTLRLKSTSFRTGQRY